MVFAGRCCGRPAERQVARPPSTNISHGHWLLEQPAANEGSSEQICDLLPACESCGRGNAREPESCDVPQLPNVGGWRAHLPSNHVSGSAGSSVLLWLCCQGGPTPGEHASDTLPRQFQSPTTWNNATHKLCPRLSV